MTIYTSFVTGLKTFVPSGLRSYRNALASLSSAPDEINIRPGKLTKSGSTQAALVRTLRFAAADGKLIGGVEVEVILKATGTVQDAQVQLKNLISESNDFLTEAAIVRLMLGDS